MDTKRVRRGTRVSTRRFCQGLLRVENGVVLLWVDPLRGLAHGLTLDSLRNLGVGIAPDVLLGLRVASRVNRWAVGTKKIADAR